MSTVGKYIEAIRTALVFFPAVALAFTIPYMFVQYRRYGAILLIRTAIIYSFVLYMLCTYFLIILPLPDWETVAGLTSRWVQLRPLRELEGLIRDVSLILCEPSEWLKILVKGNFFQIVMNVAMLVPFGVYLRYFFGCGLGKTVGLTFALSLFFELTQLSGLYFLYPRPYRLADVDDLITNTLGGLIGYWIAPLLTRVLPTRERMDARAYHKGRQLSITRRAFAALLDFTVMLGVLAVLMALFPSAVPVGQGARAMARWLFDGYAVGVVLYFMLGEWLTGGRSIGKALMHMRLTDRRDGSRPKLWQCVVRYATLYLLVLPTPATLLVAITLGGEDGGYSVWLIAGCVALVLLYILFWLLIAVYVFTHENQLLHGKLSMTQNVSTLRRGHALFHRNQKP